MTAVLDWSTLHLYFLTHSSPPNAILVTFTALTALFLVPSLHFREGEGRVHKQLTGWISDTLKL